MKAEDLMYREDLMANERILVTGGGTGLGKEMAEACLILGAHIYICGRRGSVLEEAANELMERHGGTVTPVPCDIRDADAIDDMVQRIWDDGGALTGLINNAAGNFVSRTEDLSHRAFDAVANIVFRGSFLVTQSCGKRWLAEGKPGSVVSIVTTWVWNGSPFVVPSAMSKSGINAMTQSLAVEWGNRGIRLNAIAPGLFPTEGMTKRLGPLGKMDLGDSPMGRPGRHPELANLAVFLLGPGAEYVNGQVIAIDGGQYQADGGNFTALSAWGDEEWRQAREAISTVNSQDRAKRST
ncbi:SDR family oxidoreductase [Alcanivorax sp. ZXX171]|nr:SDR family oxidoreductase [Alcanivorax sp. ZXX171]